MPALTGRRTKNEQCCICLRDNAHAVAHCGCAYHIDCLQEYVKLEDWQPEDVYCHLHGKALGSSFVKAHTPGFTLMPWDVLSPEATMQGRKFAAKHVPRASALGIAAAAKINEPAQNVGAQIIQSVESELALNRRPGSVGVASSMPCVICFGEDGEMRTLHCKFKVHNACLQAFWLQKVVAHGRFVNISCPAEAGGCNGTLSVQDLHGVVRQEDRAHAKKQMQRVAEQNHQLIRALGEPSYKPPAIFRCAICLSEHEVEGCCTLPCQHRFCFESLRGHFEVIVRERRMNRLVCPCCDFDLRSEEHIHILQQCLSNDVYDKLLEFLVRDDPRICACRHPGCEEQIFLEECDDCSNLECGRGHRFCSKCEHGPHPHFSCLAWRERLARKRQLRERRADEAAWKGALELGWKPCPRRCNFAGGYKASEECDHVTCQCGFEFCWDCGVERAVLLAHDNRWHKPSCRYHTVPSEVQERPRKVRECPHCQSLPADKVCPFPIDDGYPQSYIGR